VKPLGFVRPLFVAHHDHLPLVFSVRACIVFAYFAWYACAYVCLTYLVGCEFLFGLHGCFDESRLPNEGFVWYCMVLALL
jgi:hypothetical protein